MKPIKIFLCFYILLLYPFFVKGVNNKHFFSEKRHPGLIYDMIYDKDGFLWLGGASNGQREDKEYGLMRFDGSRFHAIELPDLGNANTGVIGMTKTKKGNFYLRCWGKGYQLLTLNPRTVQFKEITFSGFSKKLFNLSHVFSHKGGDYTIVQDSIGRTVLFRLKQGQATKVTDIKLPKQAEINQFTIFIPYKDYFLLKTNNLGIRCYDWEGREISQVSSKNPFRRFTLVSLGGKKCFLQGKKAILYTLDTKTKELVSVLNCEEKVANHAFWFWNDEEGNLLLSVDRREEVVIYKVTSRGLHKIKEIKGLNIISWPKFYAKDAMKSVWIGNQAKYLTHFVYPDEKISQYLSNKSIGALFPLSKQQLLVSTATSGIYSVNLKTHAEKPFQLKYKGKPFLLVGARNIIPEGKNYLWTNSDQCLVRINKDTRQVKLWGGEPVEALTRLNDSLLVFGAYKNDLRVFNTKTKKFHVLIQNRRNWIKDILVRGSLLYAATSGGLMIYNTETKQLEYKVPEGDKMTDRTLNCISELPEGNLVLGSQTGSVYQFDPDRGNIKLLYKLPKQIPVANLLANKEELWINTRAGFYRLDLTNGKAKAFSVIEGFSNNYATRFSTLKIGEKLFIGTRQGLNVFNPRNLQPREEKGKIVPLSLKLYDQKQDSVISFLNRKRMNLGHTFVLPAENRLFRLTFGWSGSHLDNRKTFKYRLNRRKWLRIEGGHFLQFDHLAPGSYDLEVGAFDTHGNEIGLPLYYHLKVKDFFYKRWWFVAIISFVVLFIIGGVLLAYKQQREVQLKTEALIHLNQSKRNLEEKVEIEKQLYKEQAEAHARHERDLVLMALQTADLRDQVRKNLVDVQNGLEVHQVQQRLKMLLTRIEDWSFFMEKFEEIHPDFINRLKKCYPQLTAKDLRFCALLKLRMSNKELASILHISHQSILTKRYRLRKKMGLLNEKDQQEGWILEV